MNAPKLQNSISWNAVFPTVAALLAVAAGYGWLKSDVARLSEVKRQHAVEISELRASAAADRVAAARTDTKLEQALEMLSRIERVLSQGHHRGITDER